MQHCVVMLAWAEYIWLDQLWLNTSMWCCRDAHYSVLKQTQSSLHLFKFWYSLNITFYAGMLFLIYSQARFWCMRVFPIFSLMRFLMNKLWFHFYFFLCQTNHRLDSTAVRLLGNHFGPKQRIHSMPRCSSLTQLTVSWAHIHCDERTMCCSLWLCEMQRHQLIYCIWSKAALQETLHSE